MLDRLMSSFKKLDFMGTSIKFTYRGKDTNERFLGSLLTIGAFFITLASLNNILLDYFNETNPSTKSYFTVNDDPIQLNRDNFEFMITFSYFNTSTLSITYIPFDDIEVKPLFVKYSSWNDLSISEYKKEFISCKGIYKANTEDEELFWNYYNSCLPDVNINLTTVWDNSDQNAYTIEFDPVYYNKLIEKYTYVLIAINFKKEMMSINNYTQPYSLFWTNEAFLLNKDTILFHSIELQTMEFKVKNSGFIFNSERPVFSKAMLNYINDNIKLSNVSDDLKRRMPPITIQLTTSKNKKLIEISYISLDEVLAAIGGTFNVIYFIFFLLYSFNDSMSIKQSILNSLYSMHYYEEDRKNHTCFKSNAKNNQSKEKSVKVLDLIPEEKQSNNVNNVKVISFTHSRHNSQGRSDNKLVVNNFISNDKRNVNSYSNTNKNLELYKLDQRKQYTIKYIDFCFIKINHKYNNKCPKSRLISKLIELNEKQLSIEGIIKLYYDVSTLKSIINHNTLQDERLFSIPSYNIYKEDKKEIESLITGITNNYNIWKENLIVPSSNTNFTPLRTSVEDILKYKQLSSIE